MPGIEPTARVLLKARPTEAQLADRLSEPVPPGLELYLDAEDLKDLAHLEQLACRLRELRPFPEFVYIVEGPIRSLDGSFFDLSINSEANRECLLRLANLAEAIGSEAVLIHAITPVGLETPLSQRLRRTKLEASLPLVECYVQSAQKRGLVPLLENIPPVARQRESSFMCTPIGMSNEDLIFFSSQFPGLGATVDLSHAGLYLNGRRMDPTQAPPGLAPLVRYLSTFEDTPDIESYLKSVEPYLFEVHISNARGLLDEGLPYGEGDLDLDTLANRLAASVRYLVTETLEPNPDKGIYMREALQRLEMALGRRDGETRIRGDAEARRRGDEGKENHHLPKGDGRGGDPHPNPLPPRWERGLGISQGEEEHAQNPEPRTQNRPQDSEPRAQDSEPRAQDSGLRTQDSFSQEELLGRASPSLELIGEDGKIAGRRIMVTGAAGSVGTPLALRLAELGAAELLLVDHHEHTLFRLRQELSRNTRNPAFHCILADVRDRRKLERVFREGRPEVVFHLAAYKHVHLGEENPDQTVEVNLAGTRAMMEAAAEFGVRRFVYPSSDKAVNPPSVYGATKRIAEALTLAADSHFATEFSITRFVNIVGTRGSVIETLSAQIAAGRPLTLTDPGMTRYWITMPEALRLLLQTAVAPSSGVIFMADLGPPINLVKMARHLCGLLRLGEKGEYPIQYIGSRPGERMHEILLSHTEAFEPTPYPGIVRVTSSRGGLPPYPELSRQVDYLLEIAGAGQLSTLKGRALDLANSLQ